MHIPIIAQPFGACPIQSLRRGFFPVDGVHEDTGRVVIHRQPASLRQTLSSLPPIPSQSRLSRLASRQTLAGSTVSHVLYTLGQLPESTEADARRSARVSELGSITGKPSRAILQNGHL
jgi:hypothetical protein